jgi:glutathione S-transferase
MAESLILFGGNRNTSAASLTAWLALKKSGAAFFEHWIDERLPQAHEQIERVSPNGKLPVLVHRGELVWDPLAIGEYVNETFAEGKLWPADPLSRATARSVAGELHGGFLVLQEQLPFNCRGVGQGYLLTPEVEQELVRIGAIWRHCLQRWNGPWLFGEMCLADLWCAQLVFRFRTYAIKLGDREQQYSRGMLGDPDVRNWLSECLAEGKTE